MAGALILGLAAGYHFGDVRPFLLSLRASGCNARCVLFVSETTRHLERMRAHCEVVPLQRPEGLEAVSYNALRYFLYSHFLQNSAQRYERILLTDVRDVIFQRDPFSFAWADGLNCVLEDRRMTLGACPFNAHWIRGHQGETALVGVAGEPISCSGTTVGDHDAVKAYLDQMTARLVPFAGGERMAGYDQGVHNVMVHGGAVPDVTLHDNSGPILTLGYTRGAPLMDVDGMVLNESGAPAHMVHQYDRKPALFKRIRERYA